MVQITSSRVMQRIVQVLLVCVVSVIGFQCQSVTEPTDIVPADGMRLSVTVKDQAGNPLNVDVSWKILRGKVADASFQSLPPLGNGVYSGALPIPLTDGPPDSIRVIVKTTYNGADVASYAQSLPFNGNSRLDTIRVCGEAVLPITLTKTTQPLCCGDVLPAQDMKLSMELPLQPTDTAYTVLVKLTGTAPCNVPMTIEQPIITPTDSKMDVRAVVFNGNARTIQTLPFTLTPTPNTSVQWMFTYAESPTANRSSQTHTIQFRISTASDANCVTGQATLERTTTVISGCDCPGGLDATVHAPDNNNPNKRDTICLGASPKFVTIKLPNISNNAEESCRVTFSLDSQNIPAGVRVIGFNASTNFSFAELAPGASLGDMELAITGQQTGNIDAAFVYTVKVISANNTTKDCGKLRIYYHALVNDGTCAIDSSSSIFKSRSPLTADTLHQCVGYSDQSKTLKIKNVGACPLDINLALSGANASVFSVSPLGNITIEPNKEQIITLKLLPTRNDVYPSGICDATKFILNFTAQLNITGCTPTTIPLFGRAHLESECNAPVPFTLYKYGQRDSSGTTWSTVLDLLSDNSLRARDSKAKDTAAIYVSDILTTGPGPNAGNITNATLSTGKPNGTSCWVKYLKVATGQNILSRPICDLFTQFACNPTIAKDLGNPNSTPWQCDVTVNEGDIVIFWRNGQYGMIWINKLDWKERDVKSIPGVQGEACYPFNF